MCVIVLIHLQNHSSGRVDCWALYMYLNDSEDTKTLLALRMLRLHEVLGS